MTFLFAESLLFISSENKASLSNAALVAPCAVLFAPCAVLGARFTPQSRRGRRLEHKPRHPAWRGGQGRIVTEG